MDERSVKTLERMRKHHPSEKLVVILGRDYIRYQAEFGLRINDWEWAAVGAMSEGDSERMRRHLLSQGWTDAIDIVASIDQYMESLNPVLATWTLPWPPTVNHYWASRVISPKRGKSFVSTYVSKRGMEYAETVAKLMLGKPKIKHGIPLSVHIRCYPPDKRCRDISNLEKSCTDSLVKAGMIRDDFDIWDLRLTRECLSSPPGRVVVQVRQYLFEGQDAMPAAELAVEAQATDTAHDEKQALQDLRRPLLEAPE